MIGNKQILTKIEDLDVTNIKMVEKQFFTYNQIRNLKFKIFSKKIKIKEYSLYIKNKK